jgi:signal transduction histidine kinase
MIPFSDIKKYDPTTLWYRLLAVILVMLALPISTGVADTYTHGQEGYSDTVMDTYAREGVVSLKNIERLHDPNASMTLADVLNADFLPAGDLINSGFVSGAEWFRVNLPTVDTDPVKVLLELDILSSTRVILYEPTESGQFRSREIASTTPWEQREIYYRTPVFRVDITRQEGRAVYIRVESLAAIRGKIKLWAQHALDTHIRQDTLINGAIMGGLCVNSAFALVLLFVSRRWLILLFVIYSLGFTMSMLISTGYIQWISKSYLGPKWATIALCLSVISSVANAVFSVIILGFKQYARPSYGLIIKASIAAGMLSLSIMMMGHYRVAVQINQANIIVFSIIIMVVSLYVAVKSRDGFIVALIIGYIPLRAGIIARFLSNFGIITPNFWSGPEFISISVVTHLFMIITAMVWQFSRNNRERVSAQHQLSLADKLIYQEKESNNVRFNFLRSLSHELRTPTSIINMAAQNLLYELTMPNVSHEVIARRITKIKNASDRLTDLVHSQISRFGENQHGLYVEILKIDTTTLINRISEDLKESQLGLVVTLADNIPPFLHCDEGMLRVLVRNLVSNARHYSGNLPITVKYALTDASRFSISVTDQGQGIPKDDIGHIFERNFRGANSGGHNGSGVGLYLVKTITNFHNGEVTVESVVGQGSEFRVTLPIEPPPGLSQEPPPTLA